MPGTAHGRLSFERAGVTTVLRDAYAESPLRLLTPRNHGGAAWVYTGTLGGGLVDGDRVRLRISVGAGARAFVATQGATRVYRSERGCETDTSAEVAEGAALIVAPDPTSCFAGARYHQRTAIELADGASVAFWDVLSSGRSARGERWAFERCSLELRLGRAGRALLDESWLLDPRHGALGDRLGRFEAIATLVLAGPLFAPIREQVCSRAETGTPGARARLLESVSTIGDGVLVVRLAAVSVEEMMGALRVRLAALPAFLGDDPWARRA